MGIDNDAKFVYGWTLDDDIIEIFDKMIKYEKLVIGEIDEGDEIYDRYDLLSNHMSDKYKLYLDYANPYYDCGIEESVFYISLIEYTDIKKLKELFNSDIPDDICKLLQCINLKEKDIDIHCLPHVW